MLRIRTEPFAGGDTVFSTLVVDPPWHYNDKLMSGNSGFGNRKLKRGAANHYQTMTTPEIIALGIPARVAPNAHLYLWTTNAFMEEAHAVMRAWGFTQKTILTWVKPQIGMGWYFRNNTEHVLFGVRGTLPLRDKAIPTAFVAPRLKHSEKPSRFYQLVEHASPGPYLEMFARAARPGWTVWGNEAPSCN